MKKFILSLLVAAASLAAPAETIDLSFSALGKINSKESWANSYANHSYATDNWDLAFTSFSKQTSTITDYPVTKGGNLVITLKQNQTFETVSFSLSKWSNKTKTAKLQYSSDGTNFKDFNPSISSENFEIQATSIPEGAIAIKLDLSSNSSNQVGVKSITYTTAATEEPTECDVPKFSATEIFVGGSVTITSTQGSTITYRIDDGEKQTGPSPVEITFDEIGGYAVYAKASKEGLDDSEASATIIVTEPTTYHLLKSAPVDGHIYIIAGEKDGAWKVMNNVPDKNNIKAMDVDFSNDIIPESLNEKEKFAEILLKKVGENWTLQLINNADYADGSNYLTSVDSKNNYLHVDSDATTATIEINAETGVASIIFTKEGARNNLRYNSQSGLFSCYSSGQNDAYLFEKATPVESPVLTDENGNIVSDEIDLKGGSVTLTITAAEGHHIYHKHDVNSSEPAPAEAPVMRRATDHTGFQKAETNSTTVTLNQNGTFSYYAHNPVTDVASNRVEIKVGNADTTSIAEIEGEGTVEWFDMQGRRVLSPVNGVFIMRRGGQATKVRL